MQNNRTFLLLVLVLFPSIVFSQIQNGSFENWTTTPWFQPTGWISTVNALVDGVTQSSDAYEGTSSARMEIKDFFNERVNADLHSGGIGDPIDTRPSKLGLFYKADFKNFARLEVHISTWDSNASSGALLPSGSSNTTVKNSTANWTLLEVPFDYFSTEHIPAYVNIVFALTDSAENNDLSAVGSFALIDNLFLDVATNVEKLDELPTEFALEQNYPNPFNPTTTIEYSITKPSFVTLSVFDVLGNEVVRLVNENQTSGKYNYKFDASSLASGTYLLQLNAGTFNDVKKIVLLK